PSSPILPLSLHDALPIFHLFSIKRLCHLLFLAPGSSLYLLGLLLHGFPGSHFSVSLTLLFPVKLTVCSLIAVLSLHMLQFCIERSEEHTSELQSRFDLVC